MALSRILLTKSLLIATGISQHHCGTFIIFKGGLHFHNLIIHFSSVFLLQDGFFLHFPQPTSIREICSLHYRWEKIKTCQRLEAQRNKYRNREGHKPSLYKCPMAIHYSKMARRRKQGTVCTPVSQLSGILRPEYSSNRCNIILVPVQ